MKNKKENYPENDLFIFSNIMMREAIEDKEYKLSNKILCSHDSSIQLIENLNNHPEINHNQRIINNINYANLHRTQKALLIKESIIQDNLTNLKNLLCNEKEIYCYLGIAIKCYSGKIVQDIITTLPKDIIQNFIYQYYTITLINIDETLFQFFYNHAQGSYHSNLKDALNKIIDEEGIINFLRKIIINENLTLSKVDLSFVGDKDLISTTNKDYNINLLLPFDKIFGHFHYQKETIIESICAPEEAKIIENDIDYSNDIAYKNDNSLFENYSLLFI